MIIRKSPREIERIARAGDLVAATIAHVGEHLVPGVTTAELDAIAERLVSAHGGVPTSKGYKGYPAAICISPNDLIVHGIPGAYRVQEGDVVSVDVGVTLDGAIADSAYTFAVGEVDAEVRRLLDVGQAALAAGIEQARLGNRIGDISHAVQEVVEGRGLLRRSQPRRARRRAPLSRGSARSELRPAGAGAAPRRGDDDRDRADDHGGRCRRLPARRRLVDLDLGRLNSRRISSTRWRSRTTVRGS